ncbi:MAG: substrate-binding domain-containing protein [Rhodospirillaceae bacterium]|nr:substrate-binding domain-containing protein [Rhodospirillales bacterium]
MLRRMVLAAALVLAFAPARAEDRFITIASTTSTEQSGLFNHLLPLFTQATGIGVRVVAVGTGQALKIGQQGDADALLVHDRAGEDKFVAEGSGFDRRDVMYNDFVMVGPKADPAKITGLKDATLAVSKIAAAKAPFASRGDDSGTHRAELRFWKAAGVDVKAAAGWYRELGQGMGPTLNTAAAMNAYVLADRGTWANFKNRQDLTIVVHGDKALFNPYGSILVDTKKRPADKAADAKIWHNWLTGLKGQAAIESFRINGEQVFFPQARQ